MLGYLISARQSGLRDEEIRTRWSRRNILVTVRKGTVVDFFAAADSDLSYLADCPNVRMLVAIQDSDPLTEVTDQGLKHVPQARELTEVVLMGTAITDDGLASLACLKNLRSLSLSTTQVAGNNLHVLSRIPSLQELDLSYTGLTDETAKALFDFSELRRLSVTGTSVSPSMLQELQRALPDCHID